MANCIGTSKDIKSEFDNERYKCGEVFLQIYEKAITFVCTQCAETFKELNVFTSHLYEELKANKQDAYNFSKLEFNGVQETTHAIFLQEECMTEQETVLDKVDTKQEAKPIRHRKQIKQRCNKTPQEQVVKVTGTDAKHSEDHQCHICNKVFSRSVYLIRHSHTHAAEKRYPCDLCSARFASKQNLTVHKRKHSGEKPFICEDCGKSFLTSTNLVEHRQRNHLNHRNYIKCDTCGKDFTSTYNLRLHIYAVHSNAPRDKKCEVCDGTFKTAKALNEHKKIHEGKKFQCKICDKSFAQYPGLYSHMKTHKIL